MKVKNLIEILKEQDPEMIVVTLGFEGGYTEKDFGVYPIPLKRNVNTRWYYGEHEPVFEEQEVPDFTALAIGR